MPFAESKMLEVFIKDPRGIDSLRVNPKIFTGGAVYVVEKTAQLAYESGNLNIRDPLLTLSLLRNRAIGLSPYAGIIAQSRGPIISFCESSVFLGDKQMDSWRYEEIDVGEDAQETFALAYKRTKRLGRERISPEDVLEGLVTKEFGFFQNMCEDLNLHFNLVRSVDERS